MNAVMKLWFALALGSGAVGAVACGDSERPSDGDPSTGHAGLDGLVEAYCETVRSCCQATGVSTAPLANCEAVLGRGDLVAEVRTGAVLVREPELTECVAWIESLATSCAQLDDGSPCDDIYEGTLPEGAACVNSGVCRAGPEGVACFRAGTDDGAAGKGVCKRLTPGQLGSPCEFTVERDGYRVGYSTSDPNPNPVLGTCDRRSGLYCDYATFTCKSVVGGGQPCEDYDSCVTGFYCATTCLPVGGPGATCADSDGCQAGLRCASGICTTRKITDGDVCDGDVD